MLPFCQIWLHRAVAVLRSTRLHIMMMTMMTLTEMLACSRRAEDRKRRRKREQQEDDADREKEAAELAAAVAAPAGDLSECRHLMAERLGMQHAARSCLDLPCKHHSCGRHLTG